MKYIRFLRIVGIFSWTFLNPLLCMREKTETDCLLYANCFARHLLYVMSFHFSNIIIQSSIHSFVHSFHLVHARHYSKWGLFFPFRVCASWFSKKLIWFVQDFLTKWQCQGENIRTWCSHSAWWANFEKVALVSWLKKKEMFRVEPYLVTAIHTYLLLLSLCSLEVPFPLPFLELSENKERWRKNCTELKDRIRRKKKKERWEKYRWGLLIIACIIPSPGKELKLSLMTKSIQIYIFWKLYSCLKIPVKTSLIWSNYLPLLFCFNCKHP